MTNKYSPHVYLLPEDDANSEIANGFLLYHGIKNPRSIQVLPNTQGWAKARDRFSNNSNPFDMNTYTERYLVLLIDFDNKNNRRKHVVDKIAPAFRKRVFIIGVQSEAEDLRKAGLGDLESIGVTLAKECCEKTYTVWTHTLLLHNQLELQRMQKVICPILFS